MGVHRWMHRWFALAGAIGPSRSDPQALQWQPQSDTQRKQLPHVIVIGCGFGGLEVVRVLARGQVDVTLIDRCNHHLFQPLLYQVATAGLAAPAISAPIRHILRRETRRGRLTVLQAEATDIDAAAKQVTLDDGTRMAFDHAVVAAGAVTTWFGHDDWAVHAPGLKTLANAAVGDQRRNAKLRLCRAPGLLGGNMSWQQRERGQAQERQGAQGQRMGAPTAV